MSYPSNECGECPVWLAMDEMEGNPRFECIGKYCTKCKIFNAQKFVKHIPTQCCYALEADGKTVIICGASFIPAIDNKFWEYVDKYTVKIPTPVDPYHN